MPRNTDYHGCVPKSRVQPIGRWPRSSGTDILGPMRSSTIVKLIVALLVGALAAVATYRLVRSPQLDHKVDRGNDSPGPLF
ncbi:MAG: hypothetical protein WBQ86_06175 [Candidatus Binatus sp.]